MSLPKQAHPPLPIRGSLTMLYAATLLVSALTASASAAGLLYPGILYSAGDLRRALLPNDAVNLLIGLPILIGSMILAARGRFVGFLIWPGALFFIFYDYFVYLFCMPPGPAFLAYLVLVAAAAYALVGLAAAMDANAIRDRLSGAVPARLSGGILAAMGALFLLRAAGVMIAGPDGATAADRAVSIADFLVSPAWIIGGALLLRREPLGYAVGLGLLFSLSMLFVGLIALLILQPVLTGAPFALADVIVVAAMGLVCFVPFAMFLRGAIAGQTESSA
jgi:hypothetical protein